MPKNRVRLDYDPEFMRAVREIGDIRSGQYVESAQCKEYLKSAWRVIRKLEAIEYEMWKDRFRDEALRHAGKRAIA